jgi:uncharacterized damage-inducible protein DinB
MQDDIASLFAYNRWADRRVLDACRKLTPEQYAAEPVPGWSSIRASVVHIALTTEGWIRRLAGEAVDAAPTEAELPTAEAAERHLDLAYKALDGLLPRLTPELLATPQRITGRGRSAMLPPWAIFRHVVNHTTYHRGQIAAKLKRLGLEPPATDLVYWVMEQVPQNG